MSLPSYMMLDLLHRYSSRCIGGQSSSSARPLPWSPCVSSLSSTVHGKMEQVKLDHPNLHEYDDDQEEENEDNMKEELRCVVAVVVRR